MMPDYDKEELEALMDWKNQDTYKTIQKYLNESSNKNLVNVHLSQKRDELVSKGYSAGEATLMAVQDLESKIAVIKVLLDLPEVAKQELKRRKEASVPSSAKSQVASKTLSGW